MNAIKNSTVAAKLYMRQESSLREADMQKCGKQLQGPVRGLLFLPLLQLLISCSGCSLGMLQGVNPEEVSVLSYNVQNLFDDVCDETEYPDYDPSGDEWSSALYHLKLLHVSDVISRFPEGGADILMLQEVENRNALEGLIDHYLKGAGYQHFYITDADTSAVNMAVLSRYPIEKAKAHSVSLYAQRAGRPVLECCVKFDEASLWLLNCHWKSKSGGAIETEPLRRAAAAVVASRIEKIKYKYPNAHIIIAGDLNECIDEYEQVGRSYLTALVPKEEYKALPLPQRKKSLGVTGMPSSTTLLPGNIVLWSPWLAEEHEVQGSYVFQDKWETIDHFLLSPAMCDTHGLEFEHFKVIYDERLLNDDGYPLRWISALESGYSDHLPLLLRFSVN